MGIRGAQDPIAENHLGPYWTPSSTRRPAKSPNLAASAEFQGVPKPAKRARAPTRLPPAPPERVRREKPPPQPVTIIQHIYLGAEPAHHQQIPPARRENLLDSRAAPSKWRHGPSTKMLLAADAARSANAAEWRAQLAVESGSHPIPTPPMLLLEHSLPTRPSPLAAPRPAAAAMPIAVLDVSIPIASVVVPLHGSPRAPLTPTTGVHASSPPLSQADTPPPGLHPPRRPTSASPPIVFTGGKRRRHGDLLQLSELPAVAAAYSPLRVKAARKAASVEAAAAAAAASSRLQVKEAQRARSELEARAARLERLGCAGPAREARAALAKMPLPTRPTSLVAPHAALPPPVGAGLKPVGSELRSVSRTSANTTALDTIDLDFTAGLDLLPPGEQRARLAAIDAACELVPLLEVWQAARILGQPMSEVRRADPRVVTADLIRVFGYGWAAGTLRSAAREWRNLRDYAYAPTSFGAPRVLAGMEIPGTVVDRFLNARHDLAVRKSIAKFQRLGVDPPRGHAGGHAAKGAIATAIKFLKHRCYYRIDISSTSIKRSLETARRSSGAPAPSLNPRNAFCLSEQAEHGVNEFVRGHAGGHSQGLISPCAK